MKHYIFDLSRISKDQVRAFLNRKAQEKLTGGIYLWVNQNNGHFYVGSTLHFYNRMAGYFSLSSATGIILNAY
jgi:GIY-YIG catalytic domain.